MLDINYFKMKKVLLRNFRNSRIYVDIKGVINTRFWIDKSRILINKHKIIICNDDLDCTILLDYIKKIKIDGTIRIELTGKESQYILEL